MVTSLGATHVASGDGWPDRVRGIASEGVTAVLDLVGTAVLADAVALLAGGPRVVSAAAPAAAIEVGGSGVKRRRTSEVFLELAELIAAGKLEPAGVGKLSV